jgi:DNA ligase-1
MESTFPPLSNKAKTGKSQYWSIVVTQNAEGHGVITTKYGFVGGAEQVGEKIISEGKNVGKKNETSPFQQAVSEARAAWNKKQTIGYAQEAMAGSGSGSGSGSGASASPGPDAGIAADRSAVIDVDIPLPMLAEKFQQRGKAIKFPCFIQPKFDGTRTVGLCGIPSGKPCLYSRNRKTYPHLEHIQAVLRKLPSGLILDGEVFTKALPFQEIVGLVKKKTLLDEDKPKHALLEFHVYDVVDTTKTCEERLAILSGLFKGGLPGQPRAVEGFEGAGTVLKLCPTEELASKEGLKAKHDEYVAAGFEGIMLRNKKGLYICKRSAELQKYKEMMDDEYKIVGFYEGEGEEAGCVVWECVTPEGRTFRCRPKGTHEERRALFKDGASAIGKMLTVTYQELTTDGIPRFPIGTVIRDYE